MVEEVEGSVRPHHGAAAAAAAAKLIEGYQGPGIKSIQERKKRANSIIYIHSSSIT
uniref:Uncharacterized protein n=1 Tax=Arundo donax TaxID=35708 RepID=A0A0A9HVY0_ARUDO